MGYVCVTVFLVFACTLRFGSFLHSTCRVLSANHFPGRCLRFCFTGLFLKTTFCGMPANNFAELFLCFCFSELRLITTCWAMPANTIGGLVLRLCVAGLCLQSTSWVLPSVIFSLLRLHSTFPGSICVLLCLVEHMFSVLRIHSSALYYAFHLLFWAPSAPSCSGLCLNLSWMSNAKFLKGSACHLFF